MARSTGMAIMARSWTQRWRQAAISVIREMARSAKMKGPGSRVAASRPKAVTVAANVGIQKTSERFRFHASSAAESAKAATTAAVTASGKILKRRVSSHSMGERTRAEVAAYAPPANFATGPARAAQTSHTPAYVRATATM